MSRAPSGRTGTPARDGHPRKRFAQHFLHDRAVIRRIVDEIAPRPGEIVVEIGPGRGALTFPLLTRGASCTPSRSTATSRPGSGRRRRAIRT